MPIKSKLPYFFFLLIFIPACGSLVPLSYDKHYLDIPTDQTIETEDATVILEYLELKQNHYVFDLEIINHSPSEIHVAPQQISFYASPKLFVPVTHSTKDVHALSFSNSALTMKRQFANSPAEIRNLYQARVSTRESFQVLFAVLGAGLIIYDAAKDSEDSRKETWTKKDEQKAAGRDVLVSVALAASDISELSTYQAEEDNYYLPFELFPECQIKPDASVRGKIFIPIESSYRFYRMVITVLQTDYVFDFKRRGVNSTRSQSPHHP